MSDEPPIHDLRRHASEAPERIAIVCGNERLSYGALEALANRIAAVWRQFGLARGDHVATTGPRHWRWCGPLGAAVST